MRKKLAVILAAAMLFNSLGLPSYAMAEEATGFEDEFEGIEEAGEGIVEGNEFLEGGEEGEDTTVDEGEFDQEGEDLEDPEFADQASAPTGALIEDDFVDENVEDQAATYPYEFYPGEEPGDVYRDYTGAPVDISDALQEIVVKDVNGAPLKLRRGEDKDFEIEYDEYAFDVGSTPITFYGVGQYANDDFSGLNVDLVIEDPDKKNTFVITKFDYEKVYDGVALNDAAVLETNIAAIKAETQIVRNGVETIKADKYNVAIEGTGTDADSEYVLTFSGVYEGKEWTATETKTVKIKRANISGLALSSAYTAEYNAEPQEPGAEELDKIEVGTVDDKYEAIEAGGYTVVEDEYYNNTDATGDEPEEMAYATITVDSKNYYGEGGVAFAIAPYDAKKNGIYVTVDPGDMVSFVYNGDVQTPDDGDVTATAWFGTTPGVAAIPVWDFEMRTAPEALNAEDAGSYNVMLYALDNGNDEQNLKLDGVEEAIVKPGFVIEPADMGDVAIEKIEGVDVHAKTKIDEANFDTYFTATLGEGDDAYSLVAGEDFTIAYYPTDYDYEKDSKGSTWSLKFTGSAGENGKGEGNFKGSKSKEYTSIAVELDDYFESETYENPYYALGTPIKPTAEDFGTIKGSEGQKLETTDYTLTGVYGNNVNASHIVDNTEGIDPTEWGYAWAEFEGREGTEWEGAKGVVLFEIEQLSLAKKNTSVVIEASVPDGSYYVGQKLTNATVKVTVGSKTATLTADDVYVKVRKISEDKKLETVGIAAVGYDLEPRVYPGNFKSARVVELEDTTSEIINLANKEFVEYELEVPAGLEPEGYSTDNLGDSLLVTYKGQEIDKSKYDLVYNNETRKAPAEIHAGDKLPLAIIAKEGDAHLVGTFTFEVEVTASPITSVATFEVNASKLVYSGVAQEPGVTATNVEGYKKLSYGSPEVADDYEVVYSEEHTNAGTVTVTVNAVSDDYTGSWTGEFEITKYPVDQVYLKAENYPALAKRTFATKKVSTFDESDNLKVTLTGDEAPEGAPQAPEHVEVPEKVAENFSSADYKCTQLYAMYWYDANEDGKVTEDELTEVLPDQDLYPASVLPLMVYRVNINEDSRNFMDVDKEQTGFTVAYPLVQQTLAASDVVVDFDESAQAFVVGDLIPYEGEDLDEVVSITLGDYDMEYGQDYDLAVEYYDPKKEEWFNIKEEGDPYRLVTNVNDQYRLVITFAGCFAGTVREEITPVAGMFDIENVKFEDWTAGYAAYSGSYKTKLFGYVGSKDVDIVLPGLSNVAGGYITYHGRSVKCFDVEITKDGEIGAVSNGQIKNAGKYTAVATPTAQFGGAEAGTVTHNFEVTKKVLTDDLFEKLAEKEILSNAYWYDKGVVSPVTVAYASSETVEPYCYKWQPGGEKLDRDPDFTVVEYPTTWDGESEGKALITIAEDSDFIYSGDPYEATFSWSAIELDEAYPPISWIEGEAVVTAPYIMTDVDFDGHEWVDNYVVRDDIDVDRDWVDKFVPSGDCTNAYANDAWGSILVTVPEDCLTYVPGSYEFEGSFNIAPASIKKAVVAEIKDQPWTGSPIEPTLIITGVGGESLVEGTDFHAIYDKEHTDVREGVGITITGMRNYKDETKATFNIVLNKNQVVVDAMLDALTDEVKDAKDALAEETLGTDGYSEALKNLAGTLAALDLELIAAVGVELDKANDTYEEKVNTIAENLGTDLNDVEAKGKENAEKAAENAAAAAAAAKEDPTPENIEDALDAAETAANAIKAGESVDADTTKAAADLKASDIDLANTAAAAAETAAAEYKADPRNEDKKDAAEDATEKAGSTLTLAEEAGADPDTELKEAIEKTGDAILQNLATEDVADALDTADQKAADAKKAVDAWNADPQNDALKTAAEKAVKDAEDARKDVTDAAETAGISKEEQAELLDGFDKAMDKVAETATEAEGKETKMDKADKAIEDAQKAAAKAADAAAKAAADPTEANVAAAKQAIEDAKKAIAAAEAAAKDAASEGKTYDPAADTKTVDDATAVNNDAATKTPEAQAATKASDQAAKDEEAKKTAFLTAMNAVPEASKVKDNDATKQALTQAENAYNALGADTKNNAAVKEAKAKLDAANNALANPTITIGNKKAKKAVAKNKYLKLSVGKKLKLKAKSSIGKKITYKSSKKGIASVSKKGVIKAKKAGKCKITLTCNNTTITLKVKVTGK